MLAGAPGGALSTLGPGPGENPDFLPRFDRDAQDAHKLQQSGVSVADGTLSLAFGAVRVAVARDVRTTVHFFQLILAAGVADTLGLLLTLVWTAGFLPAFLAPQAIAVLLAVCFRSTVVCVFGSISFWGICWATNFGRHAVMAAAAVAGCGKFSTLMVRLVDIGYWILPKPVDLGCLAFDALGAQTNFRPILEHSGGLSLGLSVLTSLAFTVYILIAAERQFAKMDY